MNILMLNHNRIWESTFNRAFYFGRSLVKLGHKVTVVTNSKNRIFSFNEFEHEGVKIIETPDLLWGKLRTGWDPINALRRIFYLKSMHFDIIHAFDCRPTVIIPALYLKKSLKIPLVIDWADWWGRGGAIELRNHKIINRLFEPVETFCEENFRKYADFTTVISNLLKERAINLGINERKIKVVFHGCDTDTIFPQNKFESMKELNLTKYEFILLFSGFVLYDIEMALEAFDLVLQKFPNTLLLLTGSIDPFRNLDNKNLKNNKNILVLGFLPKEKYNLVLGAVDLCLLPLSDNLANQARYPGRIGDYMAAGRPVISNKVGDTKHIIEKNNIGIITSDPASLQTLGHNARHVAEKKLSFDALSKDFESIYQKLVKMRVE